MGAIIDYRKVNKESDPDFYLGPHLLMAASLPSEGKKSKTFWSFYLSQGFHLMYLDKESIEANAFTVPDPFSIKTFIWASRVSCKLF